MHFRKSIAAAAASFFIADLAATPCISILPAFTTIAYAASNEEIIYATLVKTYGYNEAAACALLGNIRSESNFNPSAGGDGGTSYGICQWHAGRKSSLFSWCSANGYNENSIAGQLAYLDHELKTSYKKAYNALKNAENTAQGALNAAYTFCLDFERPAGGATSGNKRGKQAASYYSKYTGTQLDLDSLAVMGVEGVHVGTHDYSGIGDDSHSLQVIMDGVKKSTIITEDAQNTDFEGWDDDGKEETYTNYINSNWADISDLTNFIKDGDSGKTFTVKLEGVSAKVSSYRETIKNAIKGENNNTSVPNEDYVDLMLCILQVMSGGSPSANDPYNVKTLLWKAEKQDEEITQEKSIQYIFKLLTTSISVHNSVRLDETEEEEYEQMISDILGTQVKKKENTETASTDTTEDNEKYVTWHASVYKNSSELKQCVEGIMLGSNYSESYKDYKKKLAQYYYSNHMSKYESRVTQPDLSFGDEVLSHYKVTATSLIRMAGSYDEVPRYYQGHDDGRGWASYPYGSGTIASCGCGPTAFAMVATYLSGTEITPKDAVTWCKNQEDIYADGQGTRWTYFAQAAEYFGLGNVTQIGNSASDLETVRQSLENGIPVISAQGTGLFTQEGHYIVLSGVSSDGKILVNDPNYANAVGRGYNDREFDLYSEINAAASQYWIFEGQ